MATSLWLKASQMGKGMEWIKLPFWSLNRWSTETRPHFINYLCFCNCSQWYTGPAWCLQVSLAKHRHFNGGLPWDVPGVGKDTVRQCSFCRGSKLGVKVCLFLNCDNKSELSLLTKSRVCSKLTSQLLHQLLHTRRSEPSYLRSAQQRHFVEFSSTCDHTIIRPFQSGCIVNTEIFKAWKQLKIMLAKHSTDYMYIELSNLQITWNTKICCYFSFLPLSHSLSLSFTQTHTHIHFTY